MLQELRVKIPCAHFLLSIVPVTDLQFHLFLSINLFEALAKRKYKKGRQINIF